MRTLRPTSLALLLLCGWAEPSGWAAEAPRGRPIEYSAPRSEQTNNASSSPAFGRSTLLDQLEDEIDRPFQSIKRGDSLSGMILVSPQPLPSPPQPSQTTRDAMNRRRDAAFMSPEELFLPSSVNELYNAPELTPDGRDLRNVRPLERFLYKTDQGGVATNRPGSLSGTMGAGFNGRRDSSILNGVNPVHGNAYAPDSGLRRSLGLNSDSADARMRSIQDARDAREMFGLGEGFGGPNKLTPSQLQRRDAFMQIVNPNYTAPEPGAVHNPGGFSTPYVDSSFYDPPKLAPGVIAPPASIASPSATLTPAYTPAYTPPPEPVRAPAAPAPASPFMNVPRRNF